VDTIIDKPSVQIRSGSLIKEHRAIIRYKITDNAHLDAAEIEEMFKRAVQLTQGQPYCLLTDARVNLSATKEAREYAGVNLLRNNVIANAILTNSLPVRLLTNFYIRFNKPEVRTQMFTNENAAFEWLMNIVSI
jgi:hypothetical protein